MDNRGNSMISSLDKFFRKEVSVRPVAHSFMWQTNPRKSELSDQPK